MTLSYVPYKPDMLKLQAAKAVIVNQMAPEPVRVFHRPDKHEDTLLLVEYKGEVYLCRKSQQYKLHLHNRMVGIDLERWTELWPS